MVKKIILSLIAVLFLFLGYVSTKDGKFNYEKSTVIRAPVEKIYPYLSSFKLASQWNPYDLKDPNMKRVYSGTEGQVGSKMEFEGNSDVGAGFLEVVAMVPNQSVDLRLYMTKPVHADHIISYRLSPEADGSTRFTWNMHGDGGFMGKLIGTLIDCEKMMTKEFDVGFANLKKLMEQ